MSITAPRDVKESTYDMIKAMVHSDKVSKHANLATLMRFLHDVGPALDGVAGPDGSARLTDLLVTLWSNPASRPREQNRDIEACFRNYGIAITSPTTVNYFSEEGEDEDEDDLYSST
jgi:hypothetical protein